MVKKIIALVSCLAIVFAFSACGDKDDNSGTSTNSTDTSASEVSSETTTEAETEASYEVDTTESQESDVKITNGVLESSYYSVEVGDDWNMTNGSDTIVFMDKKGSSDSESAPNIAIVFSDEYAGASSEEKLEDLKSQYSTVDEYEIESAETTKIGDYDACEFVLSTTFLETDQVKMKLVCIIGENGGAIITYSALSDVYDETISEVDDMISTIVLK